MRTLQIFNFGRELDGARAIRIRYNKEWEEYNVELIRIDSNGKTFIRDEETYLTDDKEDAQDTAQFIFNRMLEA